MPLPSFRETPDQVTFKQGQMAKLECSVENLGTKKVSDFIFVFADEGLFEVAVS